MVTQRIAINSTTDVDIAKRKITFYGADVATPVINFIATQSPVVKTVYAAEALGEATISYTAGNNTTYSFVIKQVVGGQENTAIISYTSDASGSEAEIDAAIEGQLDTLIASGYLQLSYSNGSTAFTLTALAGYPLLTIIEGQNTTSSAVTVGAKAVNKGSDLVTAGVENAVAGNTYTSFELLTADLSLSAGQERNVWKKLIMYIKTGDTAIAKLTTILNADIFDSGQVELLS